MASKTRVSVEPSSLRRRFADRVLRKRSDFLHLNKNGNRARAGGWLLFNYSSNDLNHIRCGWTLPRKVGNAAIRNRLKRWCRIYFRERISTIDDFGVDINVVFLKTDGDFYKRLVYEDFSKQMDRAWAQLRKRL